MTAPKAIEVHGLTKRYGSALSGISGVEEVRISDAHASLAISGPMGELIRALARMPVEILSTPDPDLEEVFLGLYGADRERSDARDDGQDRDAH